MILPSDPTYNFVRILEQLTRFFPMLFLGLGFFPAAIVAGLIFYDASRRKMNPWIWATLGFFFWIPVGIAYLVVRNTHPVQPETTQKTIVSSFKRFYFWLASFITIILVCWSLSSSLNILLNQVFEIEPASFLYLIITTAQRLSISLTVLIIAFPVWAVNWILAQEYVEKKIPEEERYSVFSELRGYGYFVAAIEALTLLFFLSRFVYFGLSFLLDTGTFRADRVLSSLGTVLTALVIGIYHYKVARGASAILQGLTPPKPVKEAPKKAAVKKPAKFCGQCGTKNPTPNNFCSSCGAKL